MGHQPHHSAHVHRAGRLSALAVLRRSGRRAAQGRGRRRSHERAPHLGGNAPHQFAIRRMARFDRNQVPANGPAQEGQVAYDVQDLVPHEFLGIAQRFAREHRVVADDHGVFKAAPFDQPVANQELDLLEKTEGPGMRQFAFPVLGVDLDAVMLREPSLLVGARAGDAESLVREQPHRRVPHLELEGNLDHVWLAALLLGHHPRLLHHPAILARAAVRHRRLVRIQLDHGIIDAVARKRRQHVLHSVDARVPLGQGRRAVVPDDVLDPRLDFRLAFEVDPPETNSADGRRRHKSHRHPVSAVQTNAGITHGTIECLLLYHAEIKQANRSVGKGEIWRSNQRLQESLLAPLEHVRAAP